MALVVAFERCSRSGNSNMSLNTTGNLARTGLRTRKSILSDNRKIIVRPGQVSRNGGPASRVVSGREAGEDARDKES